MRCETGELVGHGDEGLAGDARDFLGEALGEAGGRVEPGSDRSAALGELQQVGGRALDAGDDGLHLGRVARELLAEGQRGRVLGMGAADLDDVRERRGLGLECVLEMGQAGNQAILELDRGRDVHRRGEGVIRRLAAIDMVVGMHRRLVAGLAAENLVRAVRDHLVGVHVRLGAGSRLPDDEREVVVELAVDHFLRRRDDGVGDVFLKLAERQVGAGGGLFLDSQGAHEGCRHAVVADGEILDAALGLGAPVLVGRDGHLAHRVAFNTGLVGHHFLRVRRALSSPQAIGKGLRRGTLQGLRGFFFAWARFAAVSVICAHGRRSSMSSAAVSGTVTYDSSTSFPFLS